MGLILNRKISTNVMLYFTLLVVTGYLISYWSSNTPSFNPFSSLTWLIVFSLLTFTFKPARELIAPLLDFRPLKTPSTYLYILIGLAIPYVLLKIFVHFEVLLNQTLIVYYKNGLLEGLDSYGRLINVMLFAPVWEEIFFRGILLFTLSKLTKPFWAILISSVIFALFHPMYLAISFIIGIVFCILTLKFKSLVPSMVIHSIWNLYAGKLFLYF